MSYENQNKQNSDNNPIAVHPAYGYSDAASSFPCACCDKAEGRELVVDVSNLSETPQQRQTVGSESTTTLSTSLCVFGAGGAEAAARVAARRISHETAAHRAGSEQFREVQRVVARVLG